MDGDLCPNYSELPEHIIHRIQSFLPLKESALTTLLCKSWSCAWSNRPTVDLDEAHFPKGRLAEFATKTIRRYEEDNLRINTFRLCLQSYELHDVSDLSTVLTSKALKMGATDLTLQFRQPRVVLEQQQQRPDNHILLDVVFGSENVVRLHLTNLIIHQPLKVIKCPWRLKSLTLCHVQISSDSLFSILYCCPLIENLSLTNSSSTVYFNYDEQQVVSRPAGPMTNFYNLTSLVLCSVEFHLLAWFLDDLSSKFPNLKDLTASVILCNATFFNRGPQQEKHVVSSPSLEIIIFTGVPSKYGYAEEEAVPKFEFDVPNIRKFTLDWPRIPQLSFTSTTSLDQCEVHVSLTHAKFLTPRWFRNLSEFLTELRGSKIHLCLHVFSENYIKYKQVLPEIKGLNVCEVENLTIDTYRVQNVSCIATLDGVFRICRPKMITQYVRQPSKYHEEQNTDLYLVRALKRGLNVESWMTPNKLMYGLCDLEEVDVQQLFDDEVWRSTKSFCSDLLKTKPQFVKYLRKMERRFRFQLKWKQSVS